MYIKAKPGDDLNKILNTPSDDLLTVEFPYECVFRQKVFIDRDNVHVISNGSKIVWNDHNGMRPGFGTGASATLTVRSKHTSFDGLIVENDFD
ncbi:MAG: hypothetical protein IJ663_01025 [Spirochaetales bacterium]|nr:hypothetical protein [Spirochaetales bacterium]